MVILWVNFRVRPPPSWNSVFGTTWLRFSSRSRFRARARNLVGPGPVDSCQRLLRHCVSGVARPDRSWCRLVVPENDTVVSVGWFIKWASLEDYLAEFDVKTSTANSSNIVAGLLFKDGGHGCRVTGSARKLGRIGFDFLRGAKEFAIII